MKKRKLFTFIAGILSLGLIAGALAYYTSSTNIENKLNTKAYGNELVEKFTPDQDWEPGEEVTKEVKVKNTGDYDLYVRVKLSEKWERDGKTILSIDPSDAAGQTKITTVQQDSPTDGKIDADSTVVNKSLVNTTDWINGGDGYWYYRTKVAPKAETSQFMNGIALNSDADMGIYMTENYYTTAAAEPASGQIGTTAADAASMWVPFTGAVPEGATFTRSVSSLDPTHAGYARADYTLTVTAQTAQAQDVTTVWENLPAAVIGAWGV